jgi:hypothetical protein
VNALADRTERVILSLEDNFTSGMAKAAAATALFDKALAELDGSSTKANKSTGDLGGDNGGIAKTGRQARNASNDLNKYTGRLNLLLSTAAVLGPSLVPITAGLIPALSGLAAGFGAAAGAAGVAALAFNGVGDAVKAIDAYKLEPTAENLQKMNQALRDLGPAGAEFATFIDGLEPELRALQNTARAGLFPGLEQGIDDLLPLLPRVRDFISGLSQEMGNLSAEAGQSLANDGDWQKFFDYLQRDGAPIMAEFAKATGNLSAGLANLLRDLAPLEREFSVGLNHAAASFRAWTDGLDQTQGFRDFLAYVEQQAPKDMELLAALGNALLGIIHATAPIGSAVLPILTDLANIIGVIGKSPLGPVFYTAAAGMLVLNRSLVLGTSAVGKLAASWALVSKAASDAAVAQEAAASAGLLGGAGSAAKGAAALKITGPASLLAASPYFANAGSRLASTAKFTGGAALTALIAGMLTNAGYNEVSNLVAPGQKDLGSKNNINAITGSLQHGWQSKWRDPTSFLGFNPEGFGNKGPVQSADAGLAAMVLGGQDKQAAEIFDKITAAAKKQGIALDDVKSKFPVYTAAVKQAAAANETDKKSIDTSTMSMKELRQAFIDGSVGIKQYIERQDELHQQMLSNFDAVTAFGQAVQNAAKQAASGEKGLNQFTKAGADNRQALSQMIEAWNAQPAKVKNNLDQYEDARKKLVQLATQMGATKDQIAALARAMDEPKKLVLGFQDQGVLDEIAKVKAALADIPRSISTKYYVTQVGGFNKRQAMQEATGHANGGLIGSAVRRSVITPRRFAAEGGYISGPGGPRDDLIPAYLSNGEFVVNAATTARLLPWLEQENAKGYADGGLVGGPFDYDIDSTTVAPSKSSKSASAAATKAAKKKAEADAKQAAAAAKAAHDLGLLSITLKPLNGKDFKDLRHGLHDLLDETKKNRDVLRLTGTSLKDLNKASKLLGNSLSSTKDALSTARSNRDSLESSITNGLMPDLFSTSTTSTNPFTPGATSTGYSPDSINAQIGAATAKAQVFGNLLTQAEAKGLTGDALNVVLSQGGFDALQMYANAPAATVQAFAKGYTGLEKAVNADAVAGGKAIYGAQIDRLEKEVKELNKNSKAIEKAIKDKTKLDDASRAKHSKENAAATSAGVNGAATKGKKSNPKKGHK